MQKGLGGPLDGGEGEIRTPGTLLTFARFRGGCLKPLDHLSTGDFTRGARRLPPAKPSAPRTKERAQLIRGFDLKHAGGHFETVIGLG